jgi:hypothetical protein
MIMVNTISTFQTQCLFFRSTSIDVLILKQRKEFEKIFQLVKFILEHCFHPNAQSPLLLSSRNFTGRNGGPAGPSEAVAFGAHYFLYFSNQARVCAIFAMRLLGRLAIP